MSSKPNYAHKLPRRIDTHAHVVPPIYKEWLKLKGIDAGGMAIPEWSPKTCLQFNEENGIETSILSVSTPGVHLGDNAAEAKIMSRKLNEYCHDLVESNPKNFGYFATLLLPDVENSIIEAEYALDHLKADGIVLLTNVGDKYLGDSSFEPLMDVLNKRGTVIFIHPSKLPSPAVNGIAPYVADFLLCTTRAAINISKNGWIEKYPNIKFILSHAGGFVPFTADRISLFDDNGKMGDYSKNLSRLKEFYFDTALSGPYAMPSLLEFADPKKITFGSDWPYACTEVSTMMTTAFETNDSLKDDIKDSINRKNCEVLFPRLSKYN